MSVSYRQPGVVLTDRRFTVPLDHDDPAGETIELYAREAVATEVHGGASGIGGQRCGARHARVAFIVGTGC